MQKAGLSKLIFLVKHYYVDATCLIQPNNFLKTLLYCACTFGHGLTLACLVLFSVYKGYHAMVRLFSGHVLIIGNL